MIYLANNLLLQGSTFPLWHRHFMLKWEREIREKIAKDPNFALPYWDWKDKSSCDVCNDLMFGAQKPGNGHYLSEGYEIRL